jgi:hypothetical protein
MMRNTRRFCKHTYILQQLESISRKLASPAGQFLTEEETMVLTQLRHKAAVSSHLHSLEQFFANSLIIRP